MRVQNFSVPPQEVLNSLFYGFLTNLRSHSFFVHILCSQILSKDSVTVFVNAIMYYKVMDHHIMPMSSLSRKCHHNHANVIIIMTMSLYQCNHSLEAGGLSLEHHTNADFHHALSQRHININASISKDHPTNTMMHKRWQTRLQRWQTLTTTVALPGCWLQPL